MWVFDSVTWRQAKDCKTRYWEWLRWRRMLDLNLLRKWPLCVFYGKVEQYPGPWMNQSSYVWYNLNMHGTVRNESEWMKKKTYKKRLKE